MKKSIQKTLGLFLALVDARKRKVNPMPRWHAVKMGFGLVIMACACLGVTLPGALPSPSSSPPPPPMTQHCNWGVGSNAPTQWPLLSTQVMMMPVVMNFGGPPFGTSKVAFISFENASQINRDGGGVLRVIDLNCNQIAQFPDPNFSVTIPPSCSMIPNFGTLPDLAPASGLAVGVTDTTTTDIDIIGVIDEPNTSDHKKIVAFKLAGGHLIPKWCSSPLPAGDFIPGTSAPAIAQLDRSPATQRQIIIDNKVYESNGNLRYTGFSHGGNNCVSFGGPPCPRSRTVVVANLVGGNSRPQVITGRGLYQSLPPNANVWTGTLGWWNTNVNNTSPPLVYPAVADLDLDGVPEIVVTDTMSTTLRVLSPSGTQLASIPIPNPGFNRCGGPPMIGDAHPGFLGPEIGVASCSRYTLFRYSAGTLSVIWSKPINDPSGQTTSTLYNTPTGANIYYADASNLWVFNGATGSAQSVPNTSGTAIEGPVIAAFDPGGRGAVIVPANNYHLGGFSGQKGVRIFDDPDIGRTRTYWNQHTYHVTNVMNPFGAIPVIESPSWLTPARNTYRVQQ